MSKYPSDHKINVKMEPIKGIHLADCDFTCFLFVSSKKVLSISKEQCIKQDEDNYIITFNTKDTGTGNVKLTMNIKIPDVDFEDGYKEINTEPICTGVIDL